MPEEPPAGAPLPCRVSARARPGTVLAFDFGEKRIGVAVGEAAVRIAHPLSTISAADNATRFAEIAKLIAEWRPALLVVGLPMHGDGAEHETTRLARRFVQRLEGRFSLPVALVDERLTSRAAESRLRESGVPPRRLKEALDSASACEILQSWFETGQTPGEAPPPRA
jgi:putative Holliday junction resolvase